MKLKTEMIAIIIAGVLTATVSALITQASIFAPVKLTETNIIVKVFLASFNSIVLAGLVFNYSRIYREMPTPTSRVFLIFSSALMFYAISSNPLIHLLFGYKLITLGPFTYVPDLFVSAASLAILHESYK